MTLSARMLAMFVLLVAAFGATTSASAEPTFPAYTPPVVDAADILTPQEEQQLTLKLADLAKGSNKNLVVATIPDLGGYDISDYGYRMGRAWGIGDAKTDQGAILIVAPNERKVRIEVGYGLEPVLTDGFSSDIINNIIVPQFRANGCGAGSAPGTCGPGILAATDAIVQQIQLPPEEAAANAAKYRQSRQSASDGVDLGTIIFWLIIFFFVILPILRAMSGGKRRGRRYRDYGGGPVIIWGGGGWGGGGGFGGGGFGGGGGGIDIGGGWSGGGGFGGGGASGSW